MFSAVRSEKIASRVTVPKTPLFAGKELTPAEAKLLQALPGTNEPTPLIVVTDPGFDVDDETALLVAASLQKRGLVELKAVVANTVPSTERARLSKGVLTELGLPDVPVAIGKNLRPEGKADWNPQSHRLRAPFLPGTHHLEQNAQQLLADTLRQAPDKSLTLLVIAGMSDPYELLKTHENLFAQKIKHVVLMGGVEQGSEQTDTGAQQVVRDGKGFFSANRVATNNKNDQGAADYLYRQLQKLNIPVTVVTRKAATNTPVPANYFRDLAETRHPVAEHIREIEGDFLNKFWQAAYYQQMGPGRDKQWFLDTFCKPDTPNSLSEQQDIRPHLKSRVLYDAIALLACVDELAGQLFNPVAVQVQKTVHRIIGLSDQATGLAAPEKLSQLLSALAKDALGEKA